MSISPREERQNRSKYHGRNKWETSSKISTEADRRVRELGGDYYDHLRDVTHEWELGRERSEDDPKAFDDTDLFDAYKLEATYTYTSISGTLLYQALKYRHRIVQSKKVFRMRRPAVAANVTPANVPQIYNWLMGQGDLRVPYRWPEWGGAKNRLVVFCEGEKDADRLASLGILATTLAGQNWGEEAVEAFRGKRIAVLEDNDEAGRANAAEAVEQLRPVAASVKLVRLPGLEHKGDVSDWLDAGHTAEEFLEVCAETPVDGALAMNIADMEGAEVPLQEWVLHNRIPNRSVVLYSGEGGAGKSMTALLCLRRAR
jgi:hypothetical protein